jgi:hypothetical protein
MMPDLQPADLAQNLEKSYSALQDLVTGIDLDLPIAANPGWKVRDILWHLAAWDREVAQAIEAFESGGRYSIPDFDEDRYNQESIDSGRQLSPEQVQKESLSARLEFIRVVERFPPGQMQSSLLYPWGDESGDLTRLVNYMLEHDDEHRFEIAATLNQRSDS